MYTRITKTGDRQYLQLVESFRNDRGQVRVRVIANLGRLDRLSPDKLDPLINGLNRALGRTENTSSEIIQEAGRAHGNVFALHELWCELGFQKALSRALRSSRREFDAEALIRAMVFNRLCEPDSKLGCLRWLETVAIPAMPDGVTHQQLLRAMDTLMDNAVGVEDALARQIRPLVDRDLAVVFYDLTTVRIHGEGAVEDDIRAFGMNKERGGIARQFVLGIVQTADGLPLMHTVHPGNVAETKTLQTMLKTVLQRFPIDRVILVADRGLLSLDNIHHLTEMANQGGRSDRGAYSRFTRAVAEAEMLRFVKPDLTADRFSWSIDENAIADAQLFDGKLALITNAADLTPAEAVTRYKGLADIERGFRVLKSDIEIAPVHHRLPDRIRAHALICFMALTPKFINKIDKCLISFRPNGQKCYNKSAVRLALAG